MTHTATPWEVYGEVANDDIPTISILSVEDHYYDGNPVINDGFDLAHTYGPIAQANAEFIVRACNAHDDLVKALKVAQQFISNGIEFGYICMPDTDTPDAAHKTPELIESALAKAQS